MLSLSKSYDRSTWWQYLQRLDYAIQGGQVVRNLLPENCGPAALDLTSGTLWLKQAGDRPLSINRNVIHISSRLPKNGAWMPLTRSCVDLPDWHVGRQIKHPIGLQAALAGSVIVNRALPEPVQQIRKLATTIFGRNKKRSVLHDDAAWPVEPVWSELLERHFPGKSWPIRDLLKQAFNGDQILGSGALSLADLQFPSIPKNHFNQVVWSDPLTPSYVAANLSGVVDAASKARGNVNFVTPGDIARIGLGMGSGYLSSLVVGKTLGALVGLPEEAQQKLKEGGIWAGLLTNLSNVMFPDR